MKKLIHTSILTICFTVFCLSSMAQSEIEKIADISPIMLERAAEFKKAIQTDGKYRSGAYIYTKRSIADYTKEPEKLAARLKILGITDVYLACDKALSGEDDNQLKWQRTFIRTAHEYGMKVHALRLSSARLYVNNEKLYSDCKSIIDYNYSVKKTERFDGVSADLEPHIMKKGFVDYPKDFNLYWSNDNYGIGKDNDQLLKRTVEVMKIAKKELKPLTLNQAVGFFFQPRVNNGLLQHGGADEFLKYCDNIIVMAYNFRMTRIWEMAEPILKAAGDKTQSVSVCVKTSMETVGDEGPVTSLQPHGWNNLIKTMDFLIEKGSEYPTFRGVDIFEFQGFEKMWTKEEEPTQQ